MTESVVVMLTFMSITPFSKHEHYSFQFTKPLINLKVKMVADFSFPNDFPSIIQVKKF